MYHIEQLCHTTRIVKIFKFLNYSLQSMSFQLVQVYSIVVRQSYTLQSVPPDISSTQMAPCIVIIYYNIIDCISYAVLHIPVTILKLQICTSQPFHLFHPVPQ